MPNKVPNLRHDPTNFMRGLNSGSYIDTTDQQQNGTTPVEHFTFSKFQLSPNHATGFDFVYINAVPSHNWTSDNETWILNDANSHHGDNHNSTTKVSHCRGRERFICEIDMKNWKQEM